MYEKCTRTLYLAEETAVSNQGKHRTIYVVNIQCVERGIKKCAGTQIKSDARRKIGMGHDRLKIAKQLWWKH